MSLDPFADIAAELRALGCPQDKQDSDIICDRRAFIVAASTWLCRAYDECVCVAEGREQLHSDPSFDAAADTLVNLGFCDTAASGLALVGGDSPEFLHDLVNIVKAARALYPPGSGPHAFDNEMTEVHSEEEEKEKMAAVASSVLSRMDSVFGSDYSLFSTEALSKLPLSKPQGSSSRAEDHLAVELSGPRLNLNLSATDACAEPSQTGAHPGGAASSEGAGYWESEASKSSIRALGEADISPTKEVGREVERAPERALRQEQSGLQAEAPNGGWTVEAMRQALGGALGASVKKRSHVARAIAALESADQKPGGV
jgi:hypothetical protein